MQRRAKTPLSGTISLRLLRRDLRFAVAIFFACLVLASPAMGSDVLEAGTQAYKAGDYSQALGTFAQAARRGDADAQFSLGVLYFEGKAVPQDLAQSKRWFLAAAQQGHIHAQFNLGNAYMFGRGVAMDPEKAAHWWRRAALKGSPNACYNLSTYYLERDNTAAERELGIAWLRAAANRGWEKARINLQTILEPLYGEPPEKDWRREPLRSEARLLTVDPRAYTVQLFSGSSRQSAMEFMDQTQISEQALLYRFARGRDVLWNVVFGAYTSQAEATKLIKAMKPRLKRSNPWPRQLTGVRTSILAVWKERENTVISAKGADG